MQAWKRIWREGLAPQLSDAALEALRGALSRDDGRLVQRMTTAPPAIDIFADSAVEAACALGYCGWKGDGHETVGDLSHFFERVCATADEALGEPGVCRHFLSWFDETPRREMRRQLLREVNRALNRRVATAA
ncbi:MAG: hypothetical protein U0793_14655 [Gemmataceae bacterium]